MKIHNTRVIKLFRKDSLEQQWSDWKSLPNWNPKTTIDHQFQSKWWKLLQWFPKVEQRRRLNSIDLELYLCSIPTFEGLYLPKRSEWYKLEGKIINVVGSKLKMIELTILVALMNLSLVEGLIEMKFESMNLLLEVLKSCLENRLWSVEWWSCLKSKGEDEKEERGEFVHQSKRD